MGRHDCVVLYNATSTVEGDEEVREELFPATLARVEVDAVTESLRASGFHPMVLSLERFSPSVVKRLAEVTPKFVFNLCEELECRSDMEMYMAGLFELMGIPYTGSPPWALGTALNKFCVKNLLRAAGIPTPKGFLCAPGEKIQKRAVPFPVLVKPVHEDGSLGIHSTSVCRSVSRLREQVEYVHEVYDQPALIEEYLDGREFNVSILGNDPPRVLAISEIDFGEMPASEPRIVSYRGKWDEDSPMYRGTTPVCPAVVSRQLAEAIRSTSLQSYRCIGCRDYARVDIRTDAEGNPHVLEVNPNPDISPGAGFARAAGHAGYTYTDVIHRIAQLAMERSTSVEPAVYA